MSGSSMAAAKNRLVDLLTATFAADDDVQVIYGPKATRTFTRETIITVGGITFNVLPATMSQFSDGFDENYDIAVVVESTTPAATDQQGATERALLVYDRVVAALQATPGDTAGVPGVQWARHQGRGSVIEASDERTLRKGRSTAIPFIINVQAVH